MDDTRVYLTLEFLNIPGLDNVYYETMTRQLTDLLLMSPQEISLTLYEVLTEQGNYELMLEGNFAYLLNSVTQFYEELLDNNVLILNNFCQSYIFNQILYYNYTDEYIYIGVDAKLIC